jgi:hypothetical protein
MFVMKKRESYFWPVEYSVPVDGGKYDKQIFEAEFKMLDQSRFDALAEQAGLQAVDDNDFLDEVLLGWRNVKDENGEDAPHNALHRKVLLNLPNMRQTLISAFFESMQGAARKNLLKPRSTG